MFEDIVYKWLDNALDYGIPERDFWEMTIAELVRQIESIKRTKLEEAKERAYFDYNLGNLMGHSMARLFSSSAQYPSMADAYPSLFITEEVKQEMITKQDELSAARFRQFAEAYNNKHKGGGKE